MGVKMKDDGGAAKYRWMGTLLDDDLESTPHGPRLGGMTQPRSVFVSLKTEEPCSAKQAVEETMDLLAERAKGER